MKYLFVLGLIVLCVIFPPLGLLCIFLVMCAGIMLACAKVISR